MNSAMNGMNQKFKNQIVSTKGDITLYINNAAKQQNIEKKIRKYPFIKSVIPSCNFQTILSGNSYAGCLTLCYYDKDIKEKLQFYNFKDKIIKPKNHPGVFIGKNIAEKNNLKVNDIVTLYMIPNNIEGSLREIYFNTIKIDVMITGILSTQNFILDSLTIVSSIEDLQKCMKKQLNLKSKINQIEIYSDSYDKSKTYSKMMKNDFKDLKFVSWEEEFKDLYKILNHFVIVKDALINMLMFIVLIINIICIIIFYYLKSKEIGILISLGASRYLIALIFVSSTLKYIMICGALGSSFAYLSLLYAGNIVSSLKIINVYSIFDGIIFFLTKINFIMNIYDLIYINILNLIITIVISIILSCYVFSKPVYNQIN